MPEIPQQVADHLDQAAEGLTALHHMDGAWALDIRYADDRNITGAPIYPFAACYLRTGTARKLYHAAMDLQQQGFRLVVWDGYRPTYAQQALWKAAPDPAFVTPPETGSKHTRAAAVDVTLADASGKLLEMPTDFDDFTDKAAADYPHLSEKVEKHRSILQKCMIGHGFQLLSSEWWHFEDTDWVRYPLFDADFDQLESQINHAGT